MKKSPLKQRGKKTKARMERLAKLVKFLIDYRAHGKCEICAEYPSSIRILGGAHIEPRDYIGANDTIDNIIIACNQCHNHDNYASYEHGGLKITKDRAREIVRRRNEQYLIESRWRHYNESD
jgi:hypothetical protein